MAKIIETYQAAQQTGILLNANESPHNLSTQIIQEIQAAVPSIAFNRYPDDHQQELLEAYGRVVHLPIDQILAGNGSDQMLGLMIGTFLGKGKKLYTYDPDFSMYDYYASAYEAEIEKYELRDDGTLDIDDFIRTGRQKNVSLVLFSNPNNPTGNCLKAEDIRRIADGFNGVPVVVDEAYIEFANEESALSILDQCPDLYVTRTLSKAYGFAGARVGFLLSSPENMKRMKKAAVPYALNALSMKAAVIVLNHYEEFMKQVENTKQARDDLYQKAHHLKSIYFWNSQGNFLHGKCAHKDALLKLFAKKNIVIRNYPDPETFRISIGDSRENELVMDVLEEYERRYDEKRSG